MTDYSLILHYKYHPVNSKLFIDNNISSSMQPKQNQTMTSLLPCGGGVEKQPQWCEYGCFFQVSRC